MNNKINKNESKIELLIEKLIQDTEKGKVNWDVLPNFAKKSRTISKYISSNSSLSAFKDFSIKRHLEEYKYYSIDSERSLFTEFEIGKIFLFVFYKSEEYSQNLINKLTGQDNIKIILGLSIEKQINLEELTTFDEYQPELRKLYVKAMLVKNNVFSFIDNFLKD